MFELKTLGLFSLTALAEILGCYLPYLWLREDKSAWLLLPAALCLTAFVWLLSCLHQKVLRQLRLTLRPCTASTLFLNWFVFDTDQILFTKFVSSSDLNNSR